MKTLRICLLAAVFAFTAAAQFTMPEAVVLPTPKVQFLGSAGQPLNGGKVYFYEAGTTTPQDTWTDSGALTANANPVILDSAGRANIWIKGGSYKISVYNSADVLQWTVDNVQDTTFAYVANLESITDSALLTYKPTINGVVDATATEHSIQDRLSGELWVSDYGVTGDGVTDDTDALQVALTACDSYSNAELDTTGVLRFHPGAYRIDETLQWDRCNLIGIMPQAVNFYWDGATDIPVFQKNLANATGSSNFSIFRGFGFRPGTATPQTWIRFYGNEFLDKFTRLEELQFVGGTSQAVLIDSTSFANIHWNNLRFDGQDGYAIRFNFNGAGYGGSFSLDQFTWDNNGSSTGGLGFIAFDNVIDTGGPHILAQVSNGRLEANQDMDAAGNKAIFSFLTGGATKANCTFMSLQVENVFYQNVLGAVAAPDHTLFYHDTTCTGGTAVTPIMLRNVGASGLAEIFDGNNYNWSSAFPTTGTSLFANAVFGSWSNLHSQETEFVGYEGNYPAISTRGRADTGERFFVGATGTLNWSDGAGADPTVSISKIGAGLVGVDVGALYFPTLTGSSQDGGVAMLQQNGLYFQRSTDDGHAESGGLYLGIGAGDPERGCIGAGAVTDCGTFTPVAEQSSGIKFNTGSHVLYGSNVEIFVDDALTPNTGAYDVGLTYTPKASFRAQDLAGVRTVEVGADISTGPKLTMNSLGATITGHAYANLGAPAAGTMIWCTDCTVATPCKDGGTGAWAFRTAAPAWNCPF